MRHTRYTSTALYFSFGEGSSEHSLQTVVVFSPAHVCWILACTARRPCLSATPAAAPSTAATYTSPSPTARNPEELLAALRTLQGSDSAGSSASSGGREESLLGQLVRGCAREERERKKRGTKQMVQGSQMRRRCLRVHFFDLVFTPLFPDHLLLSLVVRPVRRLLTLQHALRHMATSAAMSLGAPGRPLPSLAAGPGCFGCAVLFGIHTTSSHGTCR